MRFLLFDTITQRIIRNSDAPYIVDGQPGALPPEIVELQRKEQAVPPLTPGQRIRRIETPDVTAGIMLITWEIIEPSPEEQQALALARIKEETAAIYGELPAAVQTAFALIYVAAKEFIALGRLDVARSLIAAQPVPPELEPVKAAILDRLV